jgi:hypothetical protein
MESKETIRGNDQRDMILPKPDSRIEMANLYSLHAVTNFVEIKF